MRYCRNNQILILFIIGSIFLVGLTVIHIPKDRYFIPFIPVLVFSAMWYGIQIKGLLLNKIINENKVFIIGGGVGFLFILFYLINHSFVFPEGFSKIILIILLIGSLASIVLGFLRSGELHRKTLVNLAIITVPIFFIIFSNGPKLWAIVIRDTTSELLSNDRLNIHSYRENSMKKSFNQINSLVRPCKGIMAFEISFIGAFMDVDIDKLYNVFEIPPFGTFSDTTYQGLNPDRIDCLLISNTLKGPGGWATNQKIRYDNYIKPYAAQLVQMGAKVYDIPYYGQAIILNR